MNIPMCKEVMFNLCEFVINDVMENVREHFRDEGLDEITLEDFKGLWKEKLLETKAVEKIEIKNTPNENILKPITYKKYHPVKVPINTTQESAVRPQVGQVRQPYPVNNQVSCQNASNNLQFQHSNLQNIAIPRPQVGQVRQPRPVGSQVPRQNASNNLQFQHLNLQSLVTKPTFSVFRPQVGQVRQPQPVGSQVSHQNASNNLQFQHLNLQSLATKPTFSVFRPQVGQVRQPHPVNSQVSHQNVSNNVQNQHLNLQKGAVKQKLYKLVPLRPANQVVQSQVQYVRNPVPTNSQQVQLSDQSKHLYFLNPGLPVGQQPQMLNPVSGQEITKIYMPIMQTTRGTTNQYRNRISNPIAGNRHVPRAQNFVVRLPNSGTTNQRCQNLIVRQPSNQYLVSTANTQIPNYQNSSRVQHRQGLNQQVLTTNPSGSKFTGMVQNQVPVNTTTIPIVAALRHLRRNKSKTSTVTSQGNLNEISPPPVGQGNLNPFDKILQTDGAVDDEVDDVELMSNSDTDDSFIEVNHMSGDDDNKDSEVENANEVVENDDIHVSDISLDDELLQSFGNELDDDSEDDGEPSLNSDDDVSIESTEELFDSDNIIICQYEKVIKPYRKRNHNTWKMHLKDGFMFLNSKEYVFKSAYVETEFLTYPW